MTASARSSPSPPKAAGIAFWAAVAPSLIAAIAAARRAGLLRRRRRAAGDRLDVVHERLPRDAEPRIVFAGDVVALARFDVDLHRLEIRAARPSGRQRRG